MKIFFRKGKAPDGREGFDWTWQESMDLGGWGWCESLDAVKRMAGRMFPNEMLELVFL